MPVPSQLPAVPARGTRPRDRRDRIVSVAIWMFVHQGFHGTGMRQLADAMNMRPSSLYRHFSSKSELLLVSIRSGLDPMLYASRRGAEGLDEFLQALAKVSVTHRGTAALWTREYRHLDAQQRKTVEDDVRELEGSLMRRLTEQAGIDHRDAVARARAILAIFASISYHRLQLPRARLEELLLDIARRCTRLSISPAGPSTAGGRERVGSDVRSRLLDSATRLFAEKGYAAVGVEQIASAAGIGTGTFYSSFSSKREILRAAFAEAERRLDDEAEQLGSIPIGTPAVLDNLLDHYLSLVTTRPDLPTILVNDVFELDESDRLHSDRVVDRLLNRWARAIDDDLACGLVDGRIRSYAALWTVNALTISGPSRRAPIDPWLIRPLARTALGEVEVTAER